MDDGPSDSLIYLHSVFQTSSNIYRQTPPNLIFHMLDISFCYDVTFDVRNLVS